MLHYGMAHTEQKKYICKTDHYEAKLAKVLVGLFQNSPIFVYEETKIS